MLTLPTRSKLSLYLVCFLALLALDTWILFFNFQRVGAQEIWVKHTFAVIDQLSLLSDRMKSLEVAARRIVASGDASGEQRQLFESGTTRAIERMKNILSLTKDNLVQQEYANELFRLIENRTLGLRTYIHSGRTRGDRSATQDLLRLEGDYNRLLVLIGEMKAIETDLLDLRSEQSADSRWVFLIALFLTSAVNIGVAIFAYRQSRLHQEKLEFDAQNQSRISKENDELATASSMMTGDLSELNAADAIARYFSEFHGSAAVKVYAKDEQDELMEIGDFGDGATSRKVFGNNLVTEALRRKKIWLIDEVPGNYWYIKSGLGEAPPRSLIFVPLIFQGRLIGLIEIASLGTDQGDLPARLPKLAEIFAVGLNAASSRQQLRSLYEKTLQQAEELQAQQEELRTNNEELEQQARAMESQQQSLNVKNLELERTQRELERKAADLAQSSKYKSDFLAKMSHELRTPLNGLLILSTLLIENKEKTLTEQQRQFARSIQNAGNDLLTLINDILDLSKIEARKLTVHPTQFTLGELFASKTRTFLPQTQAKGLELIMAIDPEVAKIQLFTDRQRVDQVLRNFLSNAIKFTEKGSVTLSAQPTSDGRITFTVADTGIGIPKHKQKIIFEAFEQADTTVSGQYGGTGLGLTISRELAAILGGEINLSSQEGEGSQFRLTIPLKLSGEGLARQAPALPDQGAEHPAMPETKKGTTPQDQLAAEARKAIQNLKPGLKTILVVEDDDNFRRSVVEAIVSYGFQPVEISDGDVAVALLNIFTPDAILLDIKLPGISGLGILEMLKQMPHMRHVPVHMISGLEYQRNALRMGALGYLIKPVTIEKVRSALDRIENLLAKRVRRVLLIEDNERQNRAISALIAGQDLEVASTRTGKEALQRIKTEVFDCIILDLTLPDVSGFDLLGELRSLEISLPPVVIYTGKDLSDEEQQYLRRYSESIVIKGARSPERLLDEVNLFLHRVESSLPEATREMLSNLRSREQNFEGRTVLVVDDDVRNIFALTSALETRGLGVRIARDGEDALRQLEENPNVDAILMDIMMPKMDGFEATRRIRQNPNPRINSIPIIALTAKAMREDREKSIEAGANDYLPKPVNLENLTTVLKVWLGKESFLAP